VQHEALFEMLESLDLNGKDIMLIKNFYWDQQAAVRINGICGNHEGCETGVYSVTRFVLFVHRNDNTMYERTRWNQSRRCEP